MGCFIRMMIVAGWAVAIVQRLPAQDVDTVRVFAAIAAAEKASDARMDSIDAARCHAGDTLACRKRYPHRETWIIARPNPAGRLAELLAAVYGVDYRSDTRDRPRCPWPADEPPGAGQLVDVAMTPISDSVVRVVTSFECANRPGQLHRINQLRETWEVRRMGNSWKARHVSVSET